MRLLAGRHWSMKLLLLLLLVALALFGVWRWAVATGSAATLDWIDGRFARDRGVELAARTRYGEDAAQRIELWLPEKSDGERPLVIFFHGGGWHSGAPEDYRFVARTLGDKGYAVALAGYRLGPEGRFPAMLEDSAAAVRWVRDNAGKYGADTGRLALMGHSAGAYNALMLGLDSRWLAAAGVPQAAIAGVIGLAGPADFYPWTSDSARNAMGHVRDPAQTQPIAFARGNAPPILLLHGTADTVVRPRNSRRLEAAIAGAGGRARRIEFDGMGHAGIVMGLSRPFAQNGKVLDPVLKFLRGAGPAAPPSVAVQGKMR